MSENIYSNYPNSIDKLKELPEYQDMTIEDKRKINKYNNLLAKTNITENEKQELKILMDEMRDKMLNSHDWNVVVGAITNLEVYFRDKALPQVQDMIDGAKNEVQNTIDGAKNEVDAKIETVKPTIDNYVQDIVNSNNNIVVRYLTKSIQLNTPTNRIKIPISEFNSRFDNLNVYGCGLLLISENGDYTLDKATNEIVKPSGNWNTGLNITFEVIKNVLGNIPKIDVGLIDDGAIPIQKLDGNVQARINRVNPLITKLRMGGMF